MKNKPIPGETAALARLQASTAHLSIAQLRVLAGHKPAAKAPASVIQNLYEGAAPAGDSGSVIEGAYRAK